MSEKTRRLLEKADQYRQVARLVRDARMVEELERLARECLAEAAVRPPTPGEKGNS